MGGLTGWVNRVGGLRGNEWIGCINIRGVGC